MFCKKCGNNLPDGALFCKKCGNKVAANQPNPQAENTVTAPVAPAPAAQQPVAPAPVAPTPAAPQYTTPPPVAPQPTAPQYTAPPSVAPPPVAQQYTAPQYTAPQYGTPVPAAPKKPFPLKYVLIPTCILAVVAVVIVVLVITLKPRQSSPSGNGGLGGLQSSVGNGGGNGGDNNLGGNGGNGGGGNLGGNGGGNGGGNVGSTGFVAGGQDFNLVNAIYSREGEYTAILFEGTRNEIAMLVVAAATNAFDNSTTYNQSNFGDEIEVIAVLLDTDTGECLVGSSATQGISGARIVTGGNTEISVSGTFVSSEYGEMPFSVSGDVSYVSMDSIRDKITAYDQYSVSGGGNAGGGNGGGNQPMNCVGCSSRARGKCPDCNGDRSCHICVNGMDHCISCGGSRVCQKCGGTGDCPYCGGDGIMYN